MTTAPALVLAHDGTGELHASVHRSDDGRYLVRLTIHQPSGCPAVADLGDDALPDLALLLSAAARASSEPTSRPAPVGTSRTASGPRSTRETTNHHDDERREPRPMDTERSRAKFRAITGKDPEDATAEDLRLVIAAYRAIIDQITVGLRDLEAQLTQAEREHRD